MKTKLIAVATAAVAVISATSANASLTIGDAVSVQYYYPSLNSPLNGPVTTTYTGPGQLVSSTDTFGTFTLNDNSVTLTPGNYGFSSGDFNGPALYDLTNTNAFAGWTKTIDTIVLQSYVISGNEIAGNWQGESVTPATSATFSASMGAVPEPTTWAMMLLGFCMIGFAARRRSHVKTTVTYA